MNWQDAGRSSGRRACALLAASSAVLHTLSLGHASNLAMALVMVGMIAACLFCAHDLWTRGTSRAWVLVATMNVAMIALHMPTASHRHGDVTAGSAPALPAAMAVATVIAVVEVIVAVAVLAHRSRGTARRLGAA
jgi:hypothetical protein